MEPEYRIYYADGSAYGSENGPWAPAPLPICNVQPPLEGVVAAVSRVDERTTPVLGADLYYRLEDGTVVGTSDYGTVLRSLGWIKFGVYVAPSRMELIMRRVREEWKL